ncbi:MAG TPA: Rv3235 family protein [Nocardioides sp.]|uniref:Rv3235 family protein n=1 Tax=Nocardioides sp. TaxID=35761 RepID=UPI002EDBAB5A
MTDSLPATAVVPLRPAPIAVVQGTLALELQPRTEPPRPRVDRPGAGSDVVCIDRGVRRDAEAWSCRFVQAAVEIVGGDRPATQLVRWTTSEVYADLVRRAQLVALAGGHQPGQARVQPVRPKVVGIRTCFVAPGTVEAGVHIRYGHRSRAVAARFERRQDRWLCTALEFA